MSLRKLRMLLGLMGLGVGLTAAGVVFFASSSEFLLPLESSSTATKEIVEAQLTTRSTVQPTIQLTRAWQDAIVAQLGERGLRLLPLSNVKEGMGESFFLPIDFDQDGQLEQVGVAGVGLDRRTAVPIVVWNGSRLIVLERQETLEFPRVDALEVVEFSNVSRYSGLHFIAGDALLISKQESSSVLIYWSEDRFKSIWLGD